MIKSESVLMLGLPYVYVTAGHCPTPDPEPSSLEACSTADSLNIARFISADNDSGMAELPNTSTFSLPISNLSIFHGSDIECLNVDYSVAGTFIMSSWIIIIYL